MTELRRQISGRFLATVLALSATLTASKLSENRKPEFLAKPLETIDTHIGEWTANGDRVLPDNVVGYLTPTSYLVRSYQNAGMELQFFVAYYAKQRAGESMHSPKYCLPGGGWEVLESAQIKVPLAGSSAVQVNKYVVQNGGNRRLILYWYQSKQRVIASEYAGKLWLVRDAMVEGRTAGSIVRLSLPLRPGALEDGIAFASGIIPQVQQCF